jgi:hypothetical protein
MTLPLLTLPTTKKSVLQSVNRFVFYKVMDNNDDYKVMDNDHRQSEYCQSKMSNLPPEVIVNSAPAEDRLQAVRDIREIKDEGKTVSVRELLHRLPRMKKD